MREAFSCTFWLIHATSLTFVMIFTVPRAFANKQDLVPLGTSSYKHIVQNFSFVGKAIFAGCFCKEAEFEMRLCTAWKLVRKANFTNSQIEVFSGNFSTGRGVIQGYDAKGSCKKYAKHVINGLYGSDHLNFSNTQQDRPSSIDWRFCDDMQRNNNLGCNYTIIPAKDRNSSLGIEVHYFVRSFTNSSEHLRLGNFYQLDVEKCKDTVVNVRVSVLDGPSTRPKTTTGFFFPSPRGQRPTSRTKRVPDVTHQRRQNIGGVLLDNFAVCMASLLAAILAFF